MLLLDLFFIILITGVSAIIGLPEEFYMQFYMELVDLLYLRLYDFLPIS